MCELGGGCREEIGWEGVVTCQGGRRRGRRRDCHNSDVRAWLGGLVEKMIFSNGPNSTSECFNLLY
jgi:hypothetical protein